MFAILISCLLLFYPHGFATTQLLSSNDTQKLLSSNDTHLQPLLADFWKYWVNLPEDGNPTEDDGETVKNKCVMYESDSTTFLLNNFATKKYNQECEIKASNPIFFPFYTAWCDNGLKGHYGTQSYKDILDCALDDDRGFVVMEAWLDGKKIVDVQVDNTDIKNLKIAKNNLPQMTYFKMITSPSFYDITLTNKTQNSDIYQHQEEFAKSPKIYKAVSHCFCAFIPNIAPGNHELKYHTLLTHSTGLGGSWDYDSEVTYKLKAIK